MPEITVRMIAAVDTLPLRRDLLRPGGRLEDAVFPGDDEESTAHFGAFRECKVIGVASVYRRSRAGFDDPSAWQLRGMAVNRNDQKRGAGRALVDACVDHAGRSHGKRVWCNARLAAVEFYEKSGFEIVSDLFEIEGVGPHYVMERLLVRAKPTT